MRALGSFFHTAMNGMAVAEKMFAILDAPEPEQGTRSVDPAHAGIVVRDVSYSYDGERTVLDHVDFAAPAGSFTGIVGESGSGKSTLSRVIAGLVAPVLALPVTLVCIIAALLVMKNISRKQAAVAA